MNNLLYYVEKKGNISFKDKGFNDLDNLVFSSLSYLNYTNTCINEGPYTLEYIGREYLKNNKFKDVRRLGIAQKQAYKLLQVIVDKKRYKDLIVTDYIYNTNKDMQFSAICFWIDKHLKYICFEGTDEMISGWKEDANMSAMFPVPSQVEAIKYVNSNVRLFGPKVIIGGHSKGGNLALVSGMFVKFYKWFKVKCVYNNDGPGLRKRQFKSLRYKLIKHKYIHIVPDCSIVGILLRNDSYLVVKSTKNNILGHDLYTWLITGDKVKEGNLSVKSRKLEQSIISWLDLHDDDERKHAIKAFFKVFEDIGIDSTLSIMKIKNLIKVVHSLKRMDAQTKDLLIEFLTYNLDNVNKLESK